VTPEVLLSYANGRWSARGLGADLEHADLRSLEALIEARLAASAASCVAVRFDVSSLPAWMRQYQSHYFNYSLRLAPPGHRSDSV
jgi:hypothetical protein